MHNSTLEHSLRDLATDMRNNHSKILHIASVEVSNRVSRNNSPHDSAKNARTVNNRTRKEKIYQSNQPSERKNHLSSLSRYQMYDTQNSRLVAPTTKKFNIRKIKQLQQRRERQLERSKMKKLTDLQTDPMRSFVDELN